MTRARNLIQLRLQHFRIFGFIEHDIYDKYDILKHWLENVWVSSHTQNVLENALHIQVRKLLELLFFSAYYIHFSVKNFR